RLYAVACARRVIRKPDEIDEASAVVAVAERFADGAATDEELAAVRPCPRYSTTWAITGAEASNVVQIFTDAGQKEAKQSVKADLLREVFGNALLEAWLDPLWLTPTVVSLAQAAYEERLPSFDLDPVRLGILADALEDGGCTDEVILAHLRSPGPHVRGCWAM